MNVAARILLIFGGLVVLYGALYLGVEELDRSAMIELARTRAEAASARLEWLGPQAAPEVSRQLGVAFRPDTPAGWVSAGSGPSRAVAPIPRGRAMVHGYLGHGPGEGVLWSLLLGLMVLLASDLAARQIARPLRELAVGAERLAEGRPGPPLDDRWGDEFGQLARTFNQMSALIVQREAQLKAEHESTLRAALLKTRLLEQSYAEMRETLLTMQPEPGPMERNLKAMLALVEDLQQAAWLDQGALEVRLQPVELASELRAVCELMAPQLEARRLGLELSLPDLPPVQADPARLRQVLVNLFSNAVKFTPQGALRLSARNEGRHVVVELEDGGPGIPPEARARVFEEFQQAHPGIHQQYGGFGLGLSISRRLTELQGGQLELDCPPGRGTIARLRLGIGLPPANPDP